MAGVDYVDKCTKIIEEILHNPGVHDRYQRITKKLIKALGEEEYKEFRIWLGGPGEKNESLFKKREDIQEILEKQGFTVRISEQHWDPKDVFSKESEEILFSDLLVFIFYGEGRTVLQEAQEFAKRKKTWIFIPEDLKNHSITQFARRTSAEIEYYDFQDFQKCNDEVGVEVWLRADSERVKKFFNMGILEKIRQFVEG